MIVEIISIGNELLHGFVEDTNATYISRKLLENGVAVTFRSTTGDKKEDLVEVLKTAFGRSDSIIATGGLGPTVDDRTLEAAAEAFGLKLVKDPKLEEKIRLLYEMIGIPFAETALRQAFVPENAGLIDNQLGTAPGVHLELEGKTIIFMPGVPREMKGMLEKAIKPVVEKSGGRVFLSRSLRVFGVGESNLESALPESITDADNPSFAFLPRKFEVEMRLTARGATQEECAEILAAPCKEIYEKVGEHIFGEDDDTLPLVAFRKLKEKGMTISFAESCTGGMIGSHFTSLPGVSDVFLGSIVAYSIEAKKKLLGVHAEIIDEHGPVSEQTAIAMAEGAVERLGSDVAVSVTGNAGPTSNDTKSEVGQIYIAIAFRDPGRSTVCTSRKIKRARNDVRLITTLAALDLIRRTL